MALFFRKKALLAKVETSYGTDPTPGSSDYVLASNVSITPLEQDYGERDPLLPYFANYGSIPANARVSVEFEVEIAGGGAVDTAPKFGQLLRACGFSQTINTGVSVTYALISASFESVTIYFHLDGVLHKLTGCRGAVSFSFAHGAIPKMKFTFTGIYNAPTDTALPTIATTGWQTPLPVEKGNTTFSLHSISGILASLSIDPANEIVHRNYVNATEIVRYTGRKPAGSVQIEAASIATKDWFTAAKNGTTGTLQIVHGTTAGNKFQIDAPKVQVTNPRYEDADGVTMISMDLALRPSADTGNDELTIKTL